ncbi:MAG: ABC transporter permease [Armatimonadetes bacterium]|nr:ABC transporter permease [Armatimonadota bacterium]
MGSSIPGSGIDEDGGVSEAKAGEGLGVPVAGALEPVRRPAEARGFRWVTRRLLRHRRGAIGGVIVLLALMTAVGGRALAPQDPLQQDLPSALQGPSARHLLGVDALGRDVLSRMMYGAPISLSIGAVAVSLGLAVGGGLGIVAGYFGGGLESIIMRLADVLLAFPGILMALALVAVLGPNIQNVTIAVGVFGIPAYIRLVHSTVLSVRERPFVEAARAVGAPSVRILARHILPNIMAPLIVQSSLDLARAITVASSLSFLGLGVQPPSPEWGAMLAEGREYLRGAPHLATFPGLAVMMVVLGFNMLGDGLRDVLDPRLRGLRGLD